jgi:hypothetical protein
MSCSGSLLTLLSTAAIRIRWWKKLWGPLAALNPVIHRGADFFD